MIIRLSLSYIFASYRGMEQLVARRAHNPKVVSSSLAPATTNPFRNERVFLCSLLKYTRGLSVYWLSVRQLIFLTFYLKTNKVRNQIYTKLTVKTAETDSKIDSKNPKKSPI
jgi:hypothetical protein